MKRLRADYALRLPAKAAEVQRLLAERREEEPAQTLEAIRMAAHKLRGTAGSYGFDEVATVAALLEDRIDELDPSGRTPTGEWEVIERRVDDLARAATQASRATIPSVAPPAPDGPPTATLARILVVDDDEDFLETTVRLGQAQMIDVRTALSAEAALALIEGCRFDGVLIDVQLGGPENGFALARRLRGRSGADLCVSFVSGDDGIDNRVAGVHAGGVLFLHKPLSGSALQDAALQMASVTRAERPRVLMVEDDNDFAKQVATLLEHHEMEVDHLSDPSRVLAKLAETRPDLLLLDVMMPEVSGLEVCRTIRSMPEWRDLLILFLSAQPSTETRLACFEAGGDDYLQKPILEQELLARTRVRLERARLARERWERDSLTGLLNRRAFVNAFGQRLGAARRRGRPVTIGMLDIDHFKAINDTHGHLVGDHVLAAIGRHLARSFRPADLRGRWGGEEFVVAFDDERAEVAKAILERSLDELSREEFRGEGGETFRVTFSAGVATIPDDAGTLEDALQTADHRMYLAKAAGRAAVVSEG